MVFTRKSSFFLILSFLICALAQPHKGVVLCALASFAGLGLFFYGIHHIASQKKRCMVAFFWFFGVQTSLMLWLATPQYQGLYVYSLLALLSALLGGQFALFTSLVPARSKLSFSHIFFLSALWTLFEWVRLFFLCGFVWNPMGLTLTATPYLAQLASIFGVYGLSFVVMACNLLFYKMLKERTRSSLAGYAGLCSLPLVFSLVYIQVQQKALETDEKPLKVALVQTAIYPPEKQFFLEHREAYVDPYLQWQRIVTMLKKTGQSAFDLIVLPEAAVGFAASSKVYECSHSILKWLGFDGEEEVDEWVSNLFFTKQLAAQFKSEVIIGLEESEDKNHVLSAFFIDQKGRCERYDKRVLLPVAEYLPGAIFRKLAKRYGMSSFFTPGRKAGVFEGRSDYYPTICYEECFGDVVRRGKKAGGKVLVNLSNDAWYPHSKLNVCHFDHGKLRAIETGSFQLRACNTGVTCAIDPFGRVIAKLTGAEGDYESARGALVAYIPNGSLNTWYAQFGDRTIIVLCFAFIVCFGVYGIYTGKKA